MFELLLIFFSSHRSLHYFLLAQKVIKKSPEIDYIPILDGYLIKHTCYCDELQ